MTQADLFSAPVTPRQKAAVADPALLLPRRPADWMALVAQAGPVAIEIVVAAYWTGRAVETIAEKSLGGYTLLEDDGMYRHPTWGGENVRRVYMWPSAAELLAQKHPLVILPESVGEFSAKFRFASPRDVLGKNDEVGSVLRAVERARQQLRG